MTDIAARKAQLETRKTELLARMEGVEDELDSHDSKDWEEMATEREDDEVLEGMGVIAQNEIQRIDAALDRIDGGDYGICVTCGTAIAEKRLEILPFTPFCSACAP
jgi:RNA polymerase-binding transcription factor DksA